MRPELSCSDPQSACSPLPRPGIPAPPRPPQPQGSPALDLSESESEESEACSTGGGSAASGPVTQASELGGRGLPPASELGAGGGCSPAGGARSACSVSRRSSGGGDAVDPWPELPNLSVCSCAAASTTSMAPPGPQTDSRFSSEAELASAAEQKLARLSGNRTRTDLKTRPRHHSRDFREGG